MTRLSPERRRELLLVVARATVELMTGRAPTDRDETTFAVSDLHEVSASGAYGAVDFVYVPREPPVDEAPRTRLTSVRGGKS